jgi:hypothetical protein
MPAISYVPTKRKGWCSAGSGFKPRATSPQRTKRPVFRKSMLSRRRRGGKGKRLAERLISRLEPATTPAVPVKHCPTAFGTKEAYHVKVVCTVTNVTLGMALNSAMRVCARVQIPVCQEPLLVFSHELLGGLRTGYLVVSYKGMLPSDIDKWRKVTSFPCVNGSQTLSYAVAMCISLCQVQVSEMPKHLKWSTTYTKRGRSGSHTDELPEKRHED